MLHSPNTCILSYCHSSQRCVSFKIFCRWQLHLVPCLLSCQATIFPSMPSFSSFFAAYLYDTSPASCCWRWPENICAMIVKIVECMKTWDRHDNDILAATVTHLTRDYLLSFVIMCQHCQGNICFLTLTPTPTSPLAAVAFNVTRICFEMESVNQFVFWSWCVDSGSLWRCLVTLG